MWRDSPLGTSIGYVEGGFTYLGLMIMVAILALATSATLTMGSFVQRREAEQRLLEVGATYRQAIASYLLSSSPAEPRRYPGSLADLLKDPRFPGVRRHLRQLYPDPITGKAEWGLVQAPGGGIMGIHSISDAQPIKVAEFEADNQMFEGKLHYSEWVFVVLPSMPANGKALTIPNSLPLSAHDTATPVPISGQISSGQALLAPSENSVPSPGSILAPMISTIAAQPR